MSANAATVNTSTVGNAATPATTNTTDSSRSHGSISTTTEVPKTASPPSRSDTSSTSANTNPNSGIEMKEELSVAVGVLTSHACSEEGLEDATALLLQLSNSAIPLRSLIITLLLEG